MFGLVVNQNTYNIWQTVLAFVLMFGALIGGFSKLNKNLAKKEDIDKLREQLAEVKEGNTKENTRIIAIVEDIKEDIQNSERRLDRHIDLGGHGRVKRNPLDGADE